MAPIHAVPNVRSMPPVPQSQLPLYLAPFFAALGVLGLALVSWELPAILLLCSSGERSTLALLRAYWTGRIIFSMLAVLSPLLFLGLTLLLYWLTARKLDPELRSRTAPCVLLPFLLPLVGILMWAALAPDGTCALCDALASDIRQIETGEMERRTVFVGGYSAPDTLFRDHPEGWQVVQRTVFGPDTGRSGIVLRFPETLDAALDPEGLAVERWDTAQWYEISCTSQFRLAVQMVPVLD